jgi:hypothetical protein
MALGAVEVRVACEGQRLASSSSARNSGNPTRMCAEAGKTRSRDNPSSSGKAAAYLPQLLFYQPPWLLQNSSTSDPAVGLSGSDALKRTEKSVSLGVLLTVTACKTRHPDVCYSHGGSDSVYRLQGRVTWLILGLIVLPDTRGATCMHSQDLLYIILHL